MLKLWIIGRLIPAVVTLGILLWIPSGAIASSGTLSITSNTTLAEDHVGSITVNEDAVVLDCNGHTVSAPSPGIGMFVFFRRGVTVRNCVITGFQTGIYVYGGSGNTFERNTLRDNIGFGLFVRSTSGNVVRHNIASGHRGAGARAFESYEATANIFADNVATDNTAGFVFEYSSTDNVIERNTAVGNDTAMTLEVDSNSNTVRDNHITNNRVGLFIGFSFRNAVFNNNFIGNSIQAGMANSGNNAFNLEAPTGGNFWSDFDTPSEGCTDRNSDGFCDSPKVFARGQDNLPWTTQNGWLIRANAGPDQTVDEATVVTLDGSASTGEDLAFRWTQVAGPSITLNDPMTARPRFTAPVSPADIGSQTVTVQLTVSNSAGSSSDTVDVTVRSVNRAPFADAGVDQTVREGSDVTLGASASFDADGDLLLYRWIQTDGPPAEMHDATTARATFTAPLLPGGIGGSATLTFNLTVFDGALSSTDDVRIVVEQMNHAPVANARAPQTAHSGRLVSLAGSASDTDGDLVTLQWAQLDGPPVQLANANSGVATFTAPTVSGPTPLTFRLTATDTQLSGYADVVVTVTNGVPVCTAAHAVPDSLWPPDHRMVPIVISGVTDPDDDAVSIGLLGVSQDEPVNGLGDGDTSPDALMSDGTLLLRAERSGSGNGRVYEIRFTADDGMGGRCTGAAHVQVPHGKQAPSSVDDGQFYNSMTPSP